MKKIPMLLGAIFTVALIFGTGLVIAKQPLQLTPQEALIELGKSIYIDKDLSLNKNQSCESCHHGKAAFADPNNVNNPQKNPVSVGSDPKLTGGLNAPTAAYASGSPPMEWMPEDGLYIGGVFWNGRANGHKEFWVDYQLMDDPLYSPLAEQAQGPFTNPVEMALPSNDEVVRRVTDAKYAYLFDQAFNTVDFTDTVLTFDQIAIAIAAFEGSPELLKFTSAYDTGTMTADQQAGMELFMNEDTAMCVLCHTVDDHPVGDMFTDFSYDNLGIPVNPVIAHKEIDPGLGGFIETVLNDITGSYPATLVSMFNTYETVDGGAPADNYGKHKVATLRNVALTPPYGHNGFFPNLTSITQFYNTRDLYACEPGTTDIPATPDLLKKGRIPGYPEGVANGYCWPAPEEPTTVNDVELGNLGLSPEDVDLLVKFMEGLTDQ
jgi:cytochrome c peroxidase